MLSEKTWKLEAVARLVLGLLIVSQCLGAPALAVAQFANKPSSQPVWIFGMMVAGSAAFAAAGLFVLRKPWDLERVARSLLALLFCLYGALTCSMVAQHLAGKAGDLTPFRVLISALALDGGALLLMPFFLREHRMGLSEAFGFSANWQRAVLYGIAAACIFLPVGELLQIISAWAMSHVNWKPQIQPAVQALGNTETWRERLMLGVVTIGLAPVAEEILFRGILYPTVKRAGFPRAALWGVSVFFAVIHWNPPTFLPLFLLALVLTWLYEKTNNLLAPIAAHVVFNALNFTLFYLLPWAEDKFDFLCRLPPSP